MGHVTSAKNLLLPAPLGVRDRGQYLQFVCCFLSDLLDVSVEGQLLVQDYSKEPWCWAEIDLSAIYNYRRGVICQLSIPGEDTSLFLRLG